MEVKECSCMTLADRLFQMQLVPASVKFPRTAVHMGLLDFIQDMKLSAQVSITAWVSFLNRAEKRRSSSRDVIIISTQSNVSSLNYSLILA